MEAIFFQRLKGGKGPLLFWRGGGGRGGRLVVCSGLQKGGRKLKLLDKILGVSVGVSSGAQTSWEWD